MISWLRSMFGRRRHDAYRVFLSVSNAKELCLGIVVAANESDLFDQAGAIIGAYLWSARVFDGGFPIRVKYRWERAQ